LVTLSSPPLTTVTVDYSTLAGTAGAGSDFVPATGTISFGPGVTTQTVNIALTGDTVVEPNEKFYVKLTSASPNAYIGVTQATGTIVNDDT
jgi:hypothetical protein